MTHEHRQRRAGAARSGSVSATSENAPSRIGSKRGTSRIARRCRRSRRAPKAAKNAPATRELPPKLLVREHGQRRRRASGRTCSGRAPSRPSGASSGSRTRKRTPARSPRLSSVGGSGRAPRDEERQHERREQERRRVDVEDLRRAEAGDEQPAADGPSSAVEPLRALDERVRLRHGRARRRPRARAGSAAGPRSTARGSSRSRRRARAGAGS